MQNLISNKSSLKQEYFHYKSLFVQTFQNQVHNDLKLDRIFRIGLMGQPVLDLLPGILFQPEFIFNRSIMRQADLFFPELYRNYINKKSKIVIDETDEIILVSLILFAIWKYRPDWIFSIADLVREGRVVSKYSNTILQIACLVSYLQGEKKRFLMFQSVITSGDSYYSLLIKFLIGHKNEIQDVNHSESYSIKKIMWYDHVINKNEKEEKALIQRIIYEKPVSSNILYDIYSSLLHRGHVYLAHRYLLRFQNEFENNKFIYNLLLNQYLLNGKYLLYLRRLKKIAFLPSKWNWYEARYCLFMLGFHENTNNILEQTMHGKNLDALFADESRMFRFEQCLLAIQKGLDIEDIQDFWLNNLVKSAWLNHAKGPKRIQESFKIFERVAIQNSKKRKSCDSEQISLFFPALNDKFMLYANNKSVRNLWLVLQSIGSRILPVRLHLGFMAYNRGFTKLAKKYLQKQPVFLDEQLHQLAEIFVLDDDIDQALEIYRKLIKRTPHHAIYHYNLGILFEKSGKMDKAIEEYSHVIKLEPGFLKARDRIEFLS